jgi:isopentenyl-diphosphate delta-isomerase type 1
MKDEIFDVVNERDEVVGQATRVEVHRRGLLHRAAHVLVFNRKGQVLLQKRSMKKDRQPGLWDSSASGHLNSGENYDECAARELREEIGLQPATPLKPLFKLAASPETDQEHMRVYACHSEGPVTPDPEEIDRVQWFSRTEVDRWLTERPEDFAGAFRLIWAAIA